MLLLTLKAFFLFLLFMAVAMKGVKIAEFLRKFMYTKEQLETFRREFLIEQYILCGVIIGILYSFILVLVVGL